LFSPGPQVPFFSFLLGKGGGAHGGRNGAMIDLAEVGETGVGWGVGLFSVEWDSRRFSRLGPTWGRDGRATPAQGVVGGFGGAGAGAPTRWRGGSPPYFGTQGGPFGATQQTGFPRGGGAPSKPGGTPGRLVLVGQTSLGAKAGGCHRGFFEKRGSSRSIFGRGDLVGLDPTPSVWVNRPGAAENFLGVQFTTGNVAGPHAGCPPKGLT